MAVLTGRCSAAQGVDVEPVATFRDLVAKREFIARNFTAGEVAYINAAADPSARWPPAAARSRLPPLPRAARSRAAFASVRWMLRGANRAAAVLDS